jgi:adenylate cyclase
LGDDWTLETAVAIKALVLLLQDGREKAEGYELLASAREAAAGERSSMVYITTIDGEIARDKLRHGDIDGAVEMSRRMVDQKYKTGDIPFLGPLVDTLVEALLRRGTPSDIHEAQAAVDRLAAAPRDPALVLFEVQMLRMRTLLARAHGDDKEYREYRNRYRAMATSLGFEGHMKWAQEMR